MRGIVIAKMLVLMLWCLYLAVGLARPTGHGREATEPSSGLGDHPILLPSTHAKLWQSNCLATRYIPEAPLERT